MAKIMELNSLIHGQYPNQASFAEAIGWKRQKLNKIVKTTVAALAAVSLLAACSSGGGSSSAPAASSSAAEATTGRLSPEGW